MEGTMPHARRDAWHRQMREYLDEKKRTIAMTSWQRYKDIIEDAGEWMGCPSPDEVTMAMLEEYESSIDGNHNTRHIYCSVVRTFLVWTGNRDAARWRILAQARPTVGGIFLSEQTVEYVRQVAHQLGKDYELLYSLAVDNGCRMIDVRRMTVANAKEMLATGMSMILSKGRGGGKLRPLVLNQQTFEPLTRYLRERESLSPLLFSGLSYTAMWRRLTHLSEISKVEFSPHDLRRTFGHRHWRAGTPIETIAKLLGHEDISTSFRAYIGVQMDDMLQAQQRLGTPISCPSAPSQQVRII